MPDTLSSPSISATTTALLALALAGCAQSDCKTSVLPSISSRFQSMSETEARRTLPGAPLDVTWGKDHILVWGSNKYPSYIDSPVCLIKLYFDEKERVDYIELQSKDPCSCKAFLL